MGALLVLAAEGCAWFVGLGDTPLPELSADGSPGGSADGAFAGDCGIDAPVADEPPDSLTAEGAQDALSDATDDPEDNDGDATPSGATGGEVVADAGDDASDYGDSGGALSADAPSSPVPTSNLRLWLRADSGITCTSGRLTRWADRSGHFDDAWLQAGQLGPQCASLAGSAHTVNGVDLPYFSAPKGSDGGLVNVRDETLDVDLTFLVNSDYTIFVVQRRWADYPTGSTDNEHILGTTVLPSVELAGWGAWCNPDPVNSTLVLAYVYYAQPPQLILEQGCAGPIVANVVSVPVPQPTGLTEISAGLDQTRGHELWSMGSAIGADSDKSPLVYAGGGAIGRATLATTALGVDPRFRGDIAEVLVYDAALDEAKRLSVEAYLKQHWGY